MYQHETIRAFVQKNAQAITVQRYKRMQSGDWLPMDWLLQSKRKKSIKLLQITKAALKEPFFLRLRHLSLR